MQSNINWQQRYNELQDACMKERAALQTKCERYENALNEIAAPKPYAPDTWEDTANKMIQIANEALFAGEGEKDITYCLRCGLPEQECNCQHGNQKEDKQC